MTTTINSLKVEASLHTHEHSSARETVMDLSISVELRVAALVRCYDEDENQAVELLSTLSSVFQLSGIRAVENFLHGVCRTDLPSLFRLEAAKALFQYEELQDEIESDDEEEEQTLKQALNEMVIERNRRRSDSAAQSLKIVCSTLGYIPTPCRIEAICLLMKYEEQQETANNCFQAFVKDQEIECDFRYKTILALENLGVEYMRDRFTDDSLFSKAFVRQVFIDYSKTISKEFPSFKPKADNLQFFQLLVRRLNYTEITTLFEQAFGGGISHPFLFYILHAQLAFIRYSDNMTSYRIFGWSVFIT